MAHFNNFFMNNIFFSPEELSSIEKLQVMGGAVNPPDGIMTQVKCTNGAVACGLTVTQEECANTAPGCGTAGHLGC